MFNKTLRNKTTGKLYKVIDICGIRQDKYILVRLKKCSNEPITEVISKKEINIKFEVVDETCL